MSNDFRNDGNQQIGPDAILALAALTRLPRPKPTAAARNRARMSFLYGTQTRRQTGTYKSTRRWFGIFAAAALGVLAMLLFGSMPNQQWVVLDVKNPAGISTSYDGELAKGTLLAGGVLSTGLDSELEVQLGDQLRFRMLPGTSLELPKPPGRWFGKGRRMPISAGEIYGTSGGKQLDFDLAFATEELQANLIGTTFAVFRTAEASCVCLWQGGILVTPQIGSTTAIELEEKQRVWVYRDGRDPEIMPLSDMEIMKLQMTQDAGLANIDSLVDIE